MWNSCYAERLKRFNSQLTSVHMVWVWFLNKDMYYMLAPSLTHTHTHTHLLTCLYKNHLMRKQSFKQLSQMYGLGGLTYKMFSQIV